MSALLGCALFAPGAWLLILLRLPTGTEARRWTAWLSLAVALDWLVLLLVDADARVGRFGVTAAGVGSWLLVASITWPARRSPVALTVAAAALVTGGASLLAGGGNAADAAGGLALAIAVVLAAARAEGDGALLPAVACAIGAAALGFGVAATNDTLAVAGAAAVAAGAAWRARRAAVVLLPCAIALAGASATVEWGHVAVLAAAAAVLAGRPAVALALWAVAGAAVGVDPVLLGGAAVVVAAWLHPLGAVAAVPGVAALAAVDVSSRWQAVVVVLAAVTALRLWRPADDVVAGPVSAATAAAGALAAWLLVAPETWGSAAGLDAWGTGVVLALVAGVLGSFLVASFTDAHFTVPPLEVADPAYPVRDGRWAWRAAIASAALLAASGVALIASSLS